MCQHPTTKAWRPTAFAVELASQAAATTIMPRTNIVPVMFAPFG